ncbi:bifunctional enoyl-CoA hydratase/phosphate acetyltransferase [Sporosarcina trichiuri]|uniref:bifunctional enoyl-CoA hydratase/phosphate acetyltransferase n=1 Tax=Sporosarcina trichiuri TaxID=3056445 RepID=UPI0025B2F927|nr:bifunctional enoyl-CoA hydratase/phosphate acetyltransferase [Sporosarcina sp. 0.2-SM1T-5]WJY28419.1 bifunctional enoyl-CoA hydratase/phosphate acetyltransferase [Sporosarcina sp. 0.2-SM1T-5]
MKTLAEVVRRAAELPGRPCTAVACAADQDVLEAVEHAVSRGLAAFKLFDDGQELNEMVRKHTPELIGHPDVEFIQAAGRDNAAAMAVQSVSSGEAQVLMKGNLPTASLMKAALKKEGGLRSGNVLSHVAAFEIPGYDKLIYLTDSAMSLLPDLETKAQIIRNAVTVARACGLELPVAVPLAAVEAVNPAMQATLDAAALTMMNQRGQLDNCIVDGPMALDNAISTEAALHKGLTGPAAGKADILVAPNLESANMLYKSLTYFAKAKVGGMIQGAAAPIVMTSRADSAETKLNSLALALLVSKNQTENGGN